MENQDLELWVLEILEEASGLGLRYEVYTAANQIILENSNINIIDAYQQAFLKYTNG